MGGAYAATSNDATALYWNPAGLSSLKKNEILLDHQDWILDVDLDFVGASFKTPYGTIGAAICAMYMGEMEVTTTHNPEGTGESFNAGSLIFCLSTIFAIFFNDTATTEIYTLHIVGSVRCV